MSAGVVGLYHRIQNSRSFLKLLVVELLACFDLLDLMVLADLMVLMVFLELMVAVNLAVQLDLSDLFQPYRSATIARFRIKVTLTFFSFRSYSQFDL